MNQQQIAIPLLTPLLPDRMAIMPYLEQIDSSRQYSNFGPLNTALESRLAALFQQHTSHSLHVTTVSNATQGLELALSSLGLPPKSKVIVPALTFVASLTAIIRAGHIPVVADVDPNSWLITPEIAMDTASKSGAQAVLAVAAFGQPLDTHSWSDLQSSTGLRVLIDAAGAFGSQWVQAPDVPVVYSMHATKALAAGEGGMLVSGDADFNAHIKQLSNFGINLDANVGYPVGHLSFVGSNAKLSEYHAAVAHASLDQWDLQVQRRQDVYRPYRQSLELACGGALQWQAGVAVTAPTMLCVRMKAEARQCLERVCQHQNIATRRWYQPLLHQNSDFIQMIRQLTPVAEAIASGLIGLPFSPYMTSAEIDRVVAAVRLAVDATD